MVTKRTSHTTGNFGPHASFERVTEEFEIPEAVWEKGIDAVLQSVDGVKQNALWLALGAAAITYYQNNKDTVEVPGNVASSSTVHFKKGFMSRALDFPFSSKHESWSGRILSQSVMTEVNGTQREIPLNLVREVSLVDRRTFSFTFLDSTGHRCTVLDEAIQVKTDTVLGILGGDIISVPWKRIRLISANPMYVKPSDALPSGQ